MATLDELKTELSTAKDYKELDKKAWLEKIAYRGITRNSQKDIDWWKEMYPRKIADIRQELANGIVVDTHEPLTKEQYAQAYDEKLTYLKGKEARLLDKLAAVLKEEEYRKAGTVVRTDLHDQGTYYIDYTNGNDSNDGLSTGQAWKTINKYTTTTARTAGDIAYVRANQTHDCSGADIVFDEDGDEDNWIKIIGCDATDNDPWDDDSDVRPVIDFGDAAYQVNCSGDRYWWLENLWFYRSGDSAGCINVGGGSSTLGFLKLVECKISDGAASNVEGVVVQITGRVQCDTCEFVDTYGYSVDNNGDCWLKNCTFNGGSTSQATAAVANRGTCYIEDSAFGDSSQFSVAIFRPDGGAIYARNCFYTGTLLVNTESTTGDLFMEDEDATFEGHSTYSYTGTITRATDSPRAGGADSHAKMTSNAYCGPSDPLTLGHRMYGFAQIWLEASAEKTITVYARTGSAWDSALTAAEAYLTASYLDSAADCGRTIAQSTEQITNDAAWTAFTVTITPLKTGFVYLWFSLAKYEDAGEYIDVDIKPVVN